MPHGRSHLNVFDGCDITIQETDGRFSITYDIRFVNFMIESFLMFSGLYLLVLVYFHPVWSTLILFPLFGVTEYAIVSMSFLRFRSWLERISAP